MAREIDHPKPVADWETRGYWEGAGRHTLVLQRCRFFDNEMGLLSAGRRSADHDNGKSRRQPAESQGNLHAVDIRQHQVHEGEVEMVAARGQ